MIAVTDVRVGDDYSLIVTFNNQTRKLLDMKPYLDFGVFKKIKHPEAFKKVGVVFDTISWEGGIDLDPEFVYKNSKNI